MKEGKNLTKEGRKEVDEGRKEGRKEGRWRRKLVKMIKKVGRKEETNITSGIGLRFILAKAAFVVSASSSGTYL